MRVITRFMLLFSSIVASASLPDNGHAQSPASLRFEITFPAERSSIPLDGRLLVLISTDTASEPRFQISDAPGTQQVFGIDVDGWKPGETHVVDASAFGYPLRSQRCLPRRGFPALGGSAGRRGGRLWRSRRALLERRSDSG